MAPFASPVPHNVLSDFRATLRQVEGVLNDFGANGECWGAVCMDGHRARSGSPAEVGVPQALIELDEMRLRLRRGRALLLMEADTRRCEGARGGSDPLSHAAAVLLDVEATIARLGELFEALAHRLGEASEAEAQASSPGV